MCPKIFFNQNLAMFQQKHQKDSIDPDWRGVGQTVQIMVIEDTGSNEWAWSLS